MTGNLAGREFKNLIYAELSRIGKGLSSPGRLEILDLLCQNAKNVETIAREIDQSVAAVSHHLQILKNCRLIKSRKDGQHVYYSLEALTLELWKSLSSAGESNLAEIQRTMLAYFDESEQFSPVNFTSLKQKVSRGEVLLIDVRPEDEYRSGHFPGARSVSLHKLKAAMYDLPRNKQIVAYCRGPYCILAEKAVRTLRKNGYRAERWPEGVADWKLKRIALEYGD